MEHNNQRLLVISNVVFSDTTNTGKTLYSYIDCLPKENVRQLYFSGETPSIVGYRYYRIYDKDLIKGKFTLSKRGSEIEPINDKMGVYDWYGGSRHTHGDLARLCREILWYKSWESAQLWKFLDNFNPTAVFFVGGDFCAAYDIATRIVERYNAWFSLYITDDYLLPRKADGLFGYIRRKLINVSFKKTLAIADVFFTISDVMREEYLKRYGKNSSLIVNMPESLKENTIKTDEYINLIYAGGIGLGRGDVLRKVSKAVAKYNAQNKGKTLVKFKIYSNDSVDILRKKKISIDGNTIIGGQLSPEKLKIEYNKADIIVFVESFENKNVEITKFSLSTKIPEYMSLGKAILAVGPVNIGSMRYLEDVAMCVNDEQDIIYKLEMLLNDNKLREEFGKKAENKFLNNNEKSVVQERFIKKILRVSDL